MTGAASPRLGGALVGASAVFMLIGKALLATMSPWLFATWFSRSDRASSSHT